MHACMRMHVLGAQKYNIVSFSGSSYSKGTESRTFAIFNIANDQLMFLKYSVQLRVFLVCML